MKYLLTVDTIEDEATDGFSRELWTLRFADEVFTIQERRYVILSLIHISEPTRPY